MRVVVLAAASAVLVLGPAGPVVGQPSGAPPGMDCAKIASMPNAPMTLEACQRMVGSMSAMQGAMNDPAGQRPGDEAMSCDQIKAELMTQGGMQMNQGHVAQAQSDVADYQAKSSALQQKAEAAMAASTAVNTAAAAASHVPIPGVGKAAEAAAEAQNAATQKALNEEAKRTVAPAAQKMAGSTSVLMSDAAANLQNNPRKGRLIQLAMRKNCH